jgi:hypothetical protein
MQPGHRLILAGSCPMRSIPGIDPFLSPMSVGYQEPKTRGRFHS